MSLMVAPELITNTATRVENLGSMIRAANAAAAAPTMGLLPAGADDISAVVSEMFAEYGSAYQALGAQAAEFHEQLVERYGWASRLYADTEATSVGTLLADPDVVSLATTVPSDDPGNAISFAEQTSNSLSAFFEKGDKYRAGMAALAKDEAALIEKVQALQEEKLQLTSRTTQHAKELAELNQEAASYAKSKADYDVAVRRHNVANASVSTPAQAAAYNAEKAVLDTRRAGLQAWEAKYNLKATQLNARAATLNADAASIAKRAGQYGAELAQLQQHQAQINADFRGKIDTTDWNGQYPHELNTANHLADLGVDSKFIPEDGSPRPDAVLSDGREYDFKSPKSENPNTLWSELRKCIKQGKTNFVVDLARTTVAVDVVKAVAQRVADHYAQVGNILIIGRDMPDGSPLRIMVTGRGG